MVKPTNSYISPISLGSITSRLTSFQVRCYINFWYHSLCAASILESELVCCIDFGIRTRFQLTLPRPRSGGSLVYWGLP